VTPSLLSLPIPAFSRMLGNLSALLAKAEAFALAQGQDPDGLLGRRLAPDMFPLARQAEIAADGARGSVARLAGRLAPETEDPAFAVFNRGFERQFPPPAATMRDLVAHVDAARLYVEGVADGELEGAWDRRIVVAMDGRARLFDAVPFLVHYALPNFHFHVAMAYAILRAAGVPLGKQDFEGAPVYASAPA